jgi:D-alanyl-D-alanine endopeptidase (penicillin-binding protein 7)
MKFLLLLLLSFNCFAKDVTAKAYLVTDETGQVLSEKQADQVRPIASITKLMTAMVVLDANLDLDESIPINYKGHGYLHSHLPHSIKTLTRHELINLALVKSDNLAAYTLCESYPGGLDRCVAEMNHKAFELGMFNTHYDDPTGLFAGNVSNSRDLVKLVLKAQEYPHIMDSGSTPVVKILVKKHWWEFWNTNPLVRNTDYVLVSKTGYIDSSGGCVVMIINTEKGKRVVALLGSKNTHTRFPEAIKLLKNTD